uniref:RxLR effector candidate protein n=2 Tax=Hyaloperonospora arabidopsidis (strain Emoy2) TaxID=559515 RepID=M4BP71_HYAAE
MRYRVLLGVLVTATLVECCISFASEDMNSVEGRTLEIAKIRRLRGANFTPQEERGLDILKKIFSSPFLEKGELKLRRMIHSQPMGDSLPREDSLPRGDTRSRRPHIDVPPDQPTGKQVIISMLAALSMVGALGVWSVHKAIKHDTPATLVSMSGSTMGSGSM